MKWPFNRKSALQTQVDNLTHELANIQNFSLESSEAFDLFTQGTSTASGAAVTEKTAMQVSAVYASVRLVAGAIAGLPLPIYKRTENGRDRMKHSLAPLLNSTPAPNWLAASFWEYMAKSMLLHGDGFALIGRKGPKAVQLLPLDPRMVDPEIRNGRLIYWVTPEKGEMFGVDQDDMLHFPGLGFDGRRSLSAIQYAAREAIGLAITAEEFASQFFANGAKPDFALKSAGKLTDDSVRQLRETWIKRHGGMNRHLPAVLPQGLEVQELTMSAEDSQLMASRQFQIEDIARIFGVPPHMIGQTEKASSWGTGVEVMSIGFVKFTLKPHLTRIEQELNRKLLTTNKDLFIEFNVDGLMRGDSKAQADYYGRALGGSSGPGWMTPNEIRKLQNLKPVEDGNNLVNWSQGNEKDPAE